MALGLSQLLRSGHFSNLSFYRPILSLALSLIMPARIVGMGTSRKWTSTFSCHSRDNLPLVPCRRHRTQTTAPAPRTHGTGGQAQGQNPGQGQGCGVGAAGPEHGAGQRPPLPSALGRPCRLALRATLHHLPGPPPRRLTWPSQRPGPKHHPAAACLLVPCCHSCPAHPALLPAMLPCHCHTAMPLPCLMDR